ncbi:MAG TPA: glucan biosynthesis protein [Kiloniellales bacterium]|nr:glucan biosynthesis protein [Kiloniellales bacterium]
MKKPAMSWTRRRLLTTAGASALAFGGGPPDSLAAEQAAPHLELEEPQAFSFEGLVEQAQKLAAEDYTPRAAPAPEVVQAIDYAAHGQLRFLPRRAPHAEGPGAFPITFFHLGQFFPRPVRMHLLEGGQAREIRYRAEDFEMPEDSPARELPEDAGFAGFRFQEENGRPDWRTQDWLAFLGASYFRAIGELGQYGLSARGVAVDVAASTPEEFPDFVAFWIEVPPQPTDPAVVYALLDGPSLTGAFRFLCWRKQHVEMEVAARLFLRQDIERLGIAPLTSMFWYAEYGRRYREDWRPEVHDSDGLQLWTGGGERIWRPLNNPAEVRVSAFTDLSPRGFGLMQRDRNREHYLDGVRYQDRPSLWVEPLGDWGSGEVQLVEIPTDDEIHDNIVAFWVPRQPAEAGAALSFDYRLYWTANEPYPAAALGRCVATRMGRGGQAGLPRPEDVTKFVIEFAGGKLPDLPLGAEPEVLVEASRGEISYVFAERVPGTQRWRAHFDLGLEEDDLDPVELRLYLRLEGEPLTETWLYQFLPGGRA